MIKEIEGTNLIAVSVPADANYISLTHDFIINGKIISVYKFLRNSKLVKGTYKILGEVIKDKIGFDVEPYVELFSITRMTMFGYKNYLLSEYKNENFTCKTKEESFYSRLVVNGIYFENPLGSKDSILDNIDKIQKVWKDLEEWQSYEDKIVEKLLILEKIK